MTKHSNFFSLLLLLSIGSIFTADNLDNNPMILALRELQAEGDERGQREQFFAGFQEGVGVIRDIVIENSQTLSRELASYQGAEQLLIKPLAIGFACGSIEQLKASILALNINEKRTIALGCAGVIVVGSMAHTFNKDQYAKLFMKNCGGALGDILLQRDTRSLIDDFIIRSTFGGPVIIFDEIARVDGASSMQQINGRSDIIKIALPFVASVAGGYTGEYLTKAALNHVEFEKLVKPALDSVVECGNIVVESVKPAVESYCSIQ